MQLTLCSKVPHTTFWLHIELNKGEDLTPFAARLSELGWVQSRRPIPFPDGSSNEDWNKPGTDIFQAWTPAERRQNMRELNKLLREKQLHCARRKMTLADLL